MRGEKKPNACPGEYWDATKTDLFSLQNSTQAYWAGESLIMPANH